MRLWVWVLTLNFLGIGCWVWAIPYGLYPTPNNNYQIPYPYRMGMVSGYFEYLFLGISWVDRFLRNLHYL